jgi:hypothetical protein
LLLIAALIYCIFSPRFDEEKLLETEQKEISLASLTNFKWDYAELFVGYIPGDGLMDTPKVYFYKADKNILEHRAKFYDIEKGPPPQVSFTLNPDDQEALANRLSEHTRLFPREDENDILIYRCKYDVKIRYAYREESGNKYYFPVNCESVTYATYHAFYASQQSYDGDRLQLYFDKENPRSTHKRIKAIDLEWVEDCFRSSYQQVCLCWLI